MSDLQASTGDTTANDPSNTLELQSLTTTSTSQTNNAPPRLSYTQLAILSLRQIGASTVIALANKTAGTTCFYFVSQNASSKVVSAFGLINPTQILTFTIPSLAVGIPTTIYASAIYRKPTEWKNLDRVIRYGLIFSARLAPLAMTAMVLSPLIFLSASQDHEIRDLALNYFKWFVWVTLPGLPLSVLRRTHLGMRQYPLPVLTGLLKNFTLIGTTYLLTEQGWNIASWSASRFFTESGAFLSFALLSRTLPRFAPFGMLHQLQTVEHTPEEAQQFRHDGMLAALPVLLETFTVLFSNLMMAKLGSTVMAAHAASDDYAVWIVTLAASTMQAAMHMVINAREDQQKSVAIIIATTNLVISAALGIVFSGGANWFISRFIHDNPDAHALGINLLYLTSAIQVLDATKFAALGLLRGMRDFKYPLMVSAATSVSTIALSALLGLATPLGAYGFRLGAGLNILLANVWLWGRWHHHYRQMQKDDGRNTLKTSLARETYREAATALVSGGFWHTRATENDEQRALLDGARPSRGCPMPCMIL